MIWIAIAASVALVIMVWIILCIEPGENHPEE